MRKYMEHLSRINAATGKKFVVIIDEWDVLIRDEATEPDRYRMSILGFPAEACLREVSRQNIFSLLI